MDPISLLMAAQATVAAIKKGCEFLSEGRQEISNLKATTEKAVADAKAIFTEVTGLWGWLQGLFKPSKPIPKAPVVKEVKTPENVVKAVQRAFSKPQSQLTYEEYKAQAVHEIFEQLKVFFGIKRELLEQSRHLEEVAQTTDDIASSALDRIEIQWQLREMQKQISHTMIYGTPEELGLGPLYKDFLKTYGEIEEEQEVTRQYKKKLERDAKWQREQIQHLKIDTLVALTITIVISYVIWSVLWTISTRRY